jgi:hypothetical protein
LWTPWRRDIAGVVQGDHCLGGALAVSGIRIVLEEIGAEVAEFEVDIVAAKRVYSAQQWVSRHGRTPSSAG